MKRSFILIMAISFTIVFSWMYIQLFVRNASLSAGSDGEMVYYLQVGVFSKFDNAQRRVNDLASANIKATYYEKGNQYYVITGISTDESQKDKVKVLLENEGYGSYDKELFVQDTSTLQNIEKEKYDDLLEVMKLSK